MIYIIKSFLLVMLLILSLICDIKTKKIKNAIILPFMIVGFITGFCENGVSGFINSLCGIVFPVLIMFPLFMLRMLGAGDIKCFGSIGAIMGMSFVINSIIYSFIAGGILALIIISVNKNALKRFKYLIDYIKSCFLTYSLAEYDNLKASNGVFRFSYAIILGVSFNFIISSNLY